MRTRIKLAGLAFAVSLVVPGPARAEWLEASSANFVVYADDSERDITRFSEQLEVYHQAMELMTSADLAVPSPSNRVTVYVVKNEREVQKLYGEGARYIGGFYVPRAGGSLAIVPRVEVRSGEIDQSMLTLLHEYAHHFIIGNSANAIPRWVSEGSAEFFASAEFPRDGGIKIGMPAVHRAGEIFYARDVTIEQLLDPNAYAAGATKGFDSFYGKSWLLYHYLSMEEVRQGQLGRYLRLMREGKSSIDAGREAFGDFATLEKELDRYTRQRLSAMMIRPTAFTTARIDVRRLSAGEAEMMPLLIRSKLGVTPEEAAGLVGEFRAMAAGHPQDPAVLAALAEAEFDSGNDAEAIAAADAALALDAKRVNAYVQKGYALFRRAEQADDPDAAYKAAVAPFVALNKIENDHPLPLVYYFRSFADRGAEVPELAVDGLARATELAPFDLSLRLNLVYHALGTGDLAVARHHLTPLAFDPHGGAEAARARALIDRIDQGRPLEFDEAMKILSDPTDAPPVASEG